MTLRDFLRKKTNPLELCAICEGGWITTTCYIDHEDLYHVPPKLADREVKRDKWEDLTIANENNVCIKIPCHFIYV